MESQGFDEGGEFEKSFYDSERQNLNQDDDVQLEGGDSKKDNSIIKSTMDIAAAGVAGDGPHAIIDDVKSVRSHKSVKLSESKKQLNLSHRSK